MKKIFACSDLHGHFLQFFRNLKEAGYDRNNENHLLVVCGDIFDRGKENYDIYEYLKTLTDEKKAIVIKGNHDVMLIEYLNGTSISPWNYMMNGTNETLADFLHQTLPFETWCIFQKIDNPTYGDFATWIEIARNEINNEYPELLPWLESLPYYYETDNYIFTHGMIDGACEDWQKSNWKECVWAKPEDFFNTIVNTDKKVVVGHINCDLLRELNNQEQDNNSIYIREDGKVIGLDTCTVMTKEVNVLVIDDEKRR